MKRAWVGSILPAMVIISVFSLPVAAQERSGIQEIRQREEGNVSAVRRPLLRQAQHARTFGRVQGITQGMKHRLTNISKMLDRQLQDVERHIAALTSNGHTLTIDSELKALQDAVANAQEKIQSIVTSLDAIAESDNPKDQIAPVRALMTELKTELKNVQTAFMALRQAVRDDMKTQRVTPTP